MKKTINKNILKKLLRESLKELFEDDIQTDEYGNPIPRGGQGYKYSDEDKKDPEFNNGQAYRADGSKGRWFSRSCAMATAVLLKDRKRGQLFVLAGQRGSGTPDYQGYWNLPCGYLDYHETTKEGAAREVYEETGVKLNPDDMISFGYSSDPGQNRQNVCFFFGAILDGSIEDYPFSLANMEEDEVSGLQWVNVNDIDNVMWAFGHKKLLKEMLSKLNYTLNNDGKYGTYSLISQAIDLIQNGAEPQEIINVLENAKETLNN